jgi:nicotinamidase-related amidase
MNRSTRIMGTALALGLTALAAGSGRAADAVREWDSIKAPPAPKLNPVILQPPKVGVMVMDFNSGNCTPEQRPRCVAMVPNVRKVLDAVRAKGMTVVFIRTQAMKPEDFVAEIAPRPGEPYFAAAKEDKLIGTPVEQIFRDKGIDTILLMGHQGNGSVMVTALGAAMRGFKVIVPVDTMPAATAYQEQFAIWEIENGPAFRGLSTLTRSDMIGF